MKKLAFVAVLALSLSACATGKDAIYYCVDDATGKQICVEKNAHCQACDKAGKTCAKCKKGKKK